jgi:large repetitive protein
MRKSLAVLSAVAALAGPSALPPAAAPARAQGGVTAAPALPRQGNIPVPGAVNSLVPPSPHRPPARPADRAARSSPLAAGSYNPVTGNQGFTVFVKGNAALNATASAGPVALGGNLTFGSGTFNLATQTAGTFTAPGDSKPTGLLVGGNINWAGSASNGAVDVLSSSYIKLGDLTGSAVAQSGSAATHIVPTGDSYNSSPQVAEVVNQPTSSVTQSGLINFTSAFATFAAQSADLGACAGTIVLTSANGTPLALPLSPGTNAYVTLIPGTQNVLNISAADLANISLLQFRNDPTATMPLIINVNTAGAGNSFTWSPPNFNGLKSADAGYMLWNFPTATQVTFSGTSTVPGTIYAPGATFNDYDSNGLNGGVIAAAYAQGGSGGSPNGGQVLSTPFAATVQGCATPQLTISLSASPGTAVPGGTVHYTVSVTNSGSVAYTGATFTDSLSDVLDDAGYNGDATATAGSVAFSSPNLTWTGDLAVGATATVTFSVTVNNPDTGNKILASTITSATAGSNCASGSTDSRCSNSIPVSVLAITSNASTATVVPGATVTYTVTVANAGQTAYTGASFTVPLSGVLDDAGYDNDATATAGSVAYSAPNLTWTGNLAVGATATVTFSVKVNNPDTGNKVLASTVTSATAGSNCAAGSTDARCTSTVTVLVQGLTIALTANTSSTTPGSVVGYTVTVTNSGQTAYTGAAFTDSLSGLLDDAAYNNDASASGGSVSFASPNLSWTGNLAVGATVTVTFSVTVNNPDAGDKVLVDTVTSATPGSNCPAGGTDPRCSSTVTVLVPGLNIAVSAGSATTTPGSVVQYTVTVTNSGQTAYAGAAFTDPLGGVLDDAAYDGDASASAGTVSFASPNLSWSGSLAVGATVTVTFSVTVNNPDTGDKILASTITSATPGSNCAAGSGAGACTATVDVAVLTIVNSSNVASTTPGGVVRFTTTFTNAGQVPYTGITVATNIADILDDAVPNGDQTATSGTLSLTATAISWTGDIPVGGSVTVTGTVTVKNPDPGNKTLASTLSTAAPGSNCPAGGTDPACSVSVAVLTPALTIVKTANVTTAVPGQTVTFTDTITDTGPTSYSGATVTDTLDLLDDGVYNNNATATSGSVSYASPVLTWTGDLGPGQSAVITYTVTVNNPPTGDKLLVATAASTAVGSSCPPASDNAGCGIAIPVLTPALTIVKTASTATVVPGQTVTYTVTVTNTGQTPYTGAAFTDSLTGVLDDATYNNDATVSAGPGSVAFASPNLTWTGDLAVGASATVTYSVTVHNPDTGDKILTNTVTSATPGSNCPATGGDSRCSATVTVASAAVLTFTTTTDVSSAAEGQVVHYTITAANTGLTAYAGAVFTESLAGILDDAAYNGDVNASAGLAAFTSPNLTWAGTVPAAGSVTITFSVTVNSPDTGNKILTTALSSVSPDSNCLAGSTDPRCAATVTVSQLAISTRWNSATVTPGSVIGITTTLTNSGQTPYTGIVVSSDTANLTDDATGNGDQVATSGTIVVTTTGGYWTGDIPVGATVTITASVTVNNPDTGNKVLAVTSLTSTPGSNCPAGSTDPACTATATVTVPGLTITKTANVTTAVPGQTVTFTDTITDTGLTSYTGVAVTDTLDLLDDAAYNNNATTTGGSVSYASPVLTWTGDLIPGQSAVITYTVTVNDPDTGDKLLTGPVASTAAGSTCPPASGSPGCDVSIPVLTPALTITAAASPATAVPGGTVNYTITVTNTGQTAYTGASFTDPLDGILDDAAYDGDAAATAGAVTYAAPTLSWAGDLAIGASATVTFSVTVHNPDTGNGILSSALTSPTPGSNCPAGGTEPGCATTVDVSALTIDNTASASSTTPGSTVDYTVTIADTGQTAYTGASVTDPLDGILDDATFNNDADTTTGSVAYVSPDLTWTGDLAPGATATITFSVTVNSPDTGDKSLTSTVISASAGNNCPAGGTDARCTAVVTVLIPALTITKTATTSTTTPGSTVGFTITVDDTGPTPYTGASVTDPLGGVLNDATFNNNASATSGSVSYATPVLTWTGDLAPGSTVTITFSVTVSNPDTGDKILANTVTSTAAGSNCPADSIDPRCSVSVADLVPALTITKTASVSTATPGTAVGYTITVADTGQTAYTAATVTDSLAGVLGDASYAGDATASSGTVSYASPDLTWTGDLAVGDTVTITYSVTVNNPDTGGRVLTNTAVSAAPGSTCPPGTTSPSCTASVSVISGALSITAPISAYLGSAAPGGSISGSLGTVQVTDSRGFGAGWTATVSATAFTTGTATPAETIPISDAFYDISALSQSSGPANFTAVPQTNLAAIAQAVVTATSVSGNNSAAWDPLINVSVPSGAVAGSYTATITESVS